MRRRGLAHASLAPLLALGLSCAAEPDRTFYDDTAPDASAPRDGGKDGLATEGTDATVSDDASPRAGDAGGDAQASDDGPSGDDGSSDGEAEGGAIADGGDAGAEEYDASESDDGGDAAETDAEARDAAGDAAPDARSQDAEAGCGTPDTPLNCGACGVACGTANVADAGCVASACTYACAAGYSNCNTAAPDVGGCECHTPSCCGEGGCQTTHSNGLGQSFYDCVASGTHTEAQAMAACEAYAESTSSPQSCRGTTVSCSDEYTSIVYDVVAITSGSTTYSWVYAAGTGGGSAVGHVYNANCALTATGTWN